MSILKNLVAEIQKLLGQSPASAKPTESSSTPKTLPKASATPTKPSKQYSTIGDLSGALGYDWRDLMSSGYTHEQIQGVLDGKYTLQDLLKMKPGSKP